MGVFVETVEKLAGLDMAKLPRVWVHFSKKASTLPSLGPATGPQRQQKTDFQLRGEIFKRPGAAESVGL